MERDSWRGAWLGNSAVIDALTVQLEKQSATAWQGMSELFTHLRKEGDNLKALDLSNKLVDGCKTLPTSWQKWKMSLPCLL